MLRVHLWTMVGVAIFALTLNSAQATNSRHSGKAGQQAICQDKVGPKKLSGAAQKSEWKKCMEDANMYQ
jgi:hypothetical protein